MGNYYSTQSINNKSNSCTLRLMSYNVEWGFLKIPSDVIYDACKHLIPHTEIAQKNHLKLIGKNIGMLSPDICFLQEIGSKEVLQYITNVIYEMYNIKYDYYYSNDDEIGYQGVGALILNSNDVIIEKIPNFPLNRALGIYSKNNENFPVIVGLHLKSLYDKKSSEDIEQQIKQLKCVNEWVNKREAIICGDFNNVMESEPINMMYECGYFDLLSEKAYVPNITLDNSTEFYRDDSNKLIGSKIDYIFASKNILDNCLSSHIINIHREISKEKKNKNYRSENSDHLPVMAIIQY